jgi:hypothetical protein
VNGKMGRPACALAGACIALAFNGAASAQTAPNVPAPSGVGLQPAGELVLVHIDSTRPVDLEVKHGADWDVVCASPCDQALATSKTYRINGSGVRASRAFEIRPGSRSTLEVDPASSGAHTGAIVVTVVGGLGLVPAVIVSAGVVAAAVLGGVFICPIVEAFSKGSYVNCLGDVVGAFTPAYRQPWVWAPAAVGGAMMLVGIVWLIASPSTRVRQAAAPVTPPPPAAWRTPMWRDASGLVPPAVLTVPVLRVAF